MWVRGLKLHFLDFCAKIWVAPHVGAWIETCLDMRAVLHAHVAPHVGAWIETIFAGMTKSCSVSRTPCGCVD